MISIRLTLTLQLALFGTAASYAQAPAAPPPQPDWDLRPIYADAEAAARDRKALEADLAGLGTWRGKLNDPASLRAALEMRSKARSRGQRVWLWANLRLTRDGNDQTAAADLALADTLWSQIAAATAYFEPELVALGPERLAALAHLPALAPYRRPIEELRVRASRILPAEQEALIATLQPVLRGPVTIRDTLFNAELPYPTITVDNAPRRLSPAAMRRTLSSPDRTTRKAAHEAFAVTQGQFKGTQAAMLSAYLGGLAWEAKARGWPSQTDMVTASDPMPMGAFAALTSEAERAAQGPFARYAELKARMLGLPALASYDLAAPFVAETRTFTVDEAKALTIAAVAPLGREYQDRLARGMAGKWMDWHPLPAKAPGGNAMYGSAEVPAYISIGFAGTPASVALLAHEWGHWMNWEYARETGRPFETLSPRTTTNDLITFVHEMLVADAAIAKAKTRDERIMALTSAIEEVRGAYYGVIAQAAFDIALRDAVDAGKPLTPDAVSALYCDARKRFSPPIVAWEPNDCLGWVTEPYVYYDLYFYRYILATNAAASFVARLQRGQQDVGRRLKGLLRAGASEDGETLLRKAGFDVADPASFAGMRIRMERLVSQLEKELSGG